ncbi:MAG: N-acetyltransferase [Acidimicrobiales bacterium]
MSALRAPRLLRNEDDLDEFRCRSSEQTEWLHRHAKQSAAMGATKVFIVTNEANHVVAYYAWTMAQLSVGAAPARMLKGAGKYPQPVALLARLGVDERIEGEGVGAALLTDVITRLLSIEGEIGCRGLLIHCESDQARDFYLHLVPGFEPSPTDPLHLVLLIKDARQTFARISRTEPTTDV